jgi:hypothetical protein
MKIVQKEAFAKVHTAPQVLRHAVILAVLFNMVKRDLQGKKFIVTVNRRVPGYFSYNASDRLYREHIR